jgi:hypothetical protein
MPTAKPRINIMVDDEVYSVIREFAETSNISMSALIAIILDDYVPAMKKANEKMKRQQMRNWKNLLDDAMSAKQWKVKIDGAEYLINLQRLAGHAAIVLSAVIGCKESIWQQRR